MARHVQAVVIGAGPGGYVAALRLAQHGIETALIERDKIGGTCLHRGCIPTKALIKSAYLSEQIKQAAAFGLNAGSVAVDMPQVQARSQAVVDQLRKGIEFLLAKRRVQVIMGQAEFQDEHRVRVNNEDITFDQAIIAVGSRPAGLAHIKPDPGNGILTSDELVRMEQVPSRLLIIGGGVIGCEFAYLCAALGSSVTVVELTEQLIPQEDPDAGRFLAAELKKKGVAILTKTSVTKITRDQQGVKCNLSSGSEITADAVLLAVGRTPNTDTCGIERLGITGERGIIKVNEFLQTRIAHLYAIGDSTGSWWLAHVASAQAKTAADAIAGIKQPMDYQAIPRCIYTHPEIAGCGLTETQAKEQNISVRVGKFPFSALGRAVIEQETRGMVKIIVQIEDDRILGASVYGPGATELIAELSVAVRMQMTSSQLGDVIHAHPTLSEAVMEAAQAVSGRAIHTL